MRQLFPSAYDRDRIIEKLLKNERRNRRRLEQIEVCERAGVSQTAVSNVERIATTRPVKKRQVRRASFLRILTSGLELEPERINALLWLYDGQPLTENEFAEHIRNYLPQAHYISENSHEALRRRVLDMLQEGLDYIFSSGEAQSARVQTFSKNQQVASEEAVYKMESSSGMQRFITEYPPYIFFGKDYVEKDIRRNHPNESHERLISIHEQRTQMLNCTFSHYGCRAIFSKMSLAQHFQKFQNSPAAITSCQELIANCVCLLRTYEHFEVGLAMSTPDLEIDMKSSEQAMLQGAGGYSFTQDSIWKDWGPYYIHWFDEANVLTFFLQFENAWDTIPVEDRTRESVIDWLTNRPGVRALVEQN